MYSHPVRSGEQRRSFKEDLNSVRYCHIIYLPSFVSSFYFHYLHQLLSHSRLNVLFHPHDPSMKFSAILASILLAISALAAAIPAAEPFDMKDLFAYTNTGHCSLSGKSVAADLVRLEFLLLLTQISKLVLTSPVSNANVPVGSAKVRMANQLVTTDPGQSYTKTLSLARVLKVRLNPSRDEIRLCS